MMKKNKLVPELRFSEFEGEWKKNLLGDLMSFKNGVNASKDDYGSGYKFINVLDIIENNFITHDLIIGSVSINEDDFNKNIVEYGDLLFQRSSETREDVGQSNVYLDKEKAATFGGFVIRGKKLNIPFDSIFLNFLLKTQKSRNEITTKSGGSTRYNVGQTTLSEAIVHLPHPNEQQKIANFLTKVDARIQLLQDKKSKLERYKKGVMQQIFSKKIRFTQEDGTDFGDWEVRRLGEVADYYDGTHQTPKYVKKGVPFYSVEHITANQFSKTKYITKEVYDKENERVKLEKGDILMTRIGSIGVPKHIDWDVKASFYVSLALIKQNPNFSGKYLAFAISSRFVQKELWKRTIHVAFPQKINLGEIGNCKIPLPTLPEQQKIANFLSALDQQIEQVGKQVEQMQVWKKGLLQKMFV